MSDVSASDVKPANIKAKSVSHCVKNALASLSQGELHDHGDVSAPPSFRCQAPVFGGCGREERGERISAVRKGEVSEPLT